MTNWEISVIDAAKKLRDARLALDAAELAEDHELDRHLTTFNALHERRNVAVMAVTEAVAAMKTIVRMDVE